MATSKLEFNNYKYKVNLNTTNQIPYRDYDLLSLLQNNEKIIDDEICTFEGMFTGGVRTGFCHLYNQKRFGWIMCMHYGNAPRFLTIDNSVVTVNPFASS